MRKLQNTKTNAKNFSAKPNNRMISGGWDKWKDQGALHWGRTWGRRVHKHLFCLGNQSMLWVGIKLKVNFAIRWVMWLRTDWTQVWKPGGLALHMSDKKICWQQQLHLYHIIVSVSKSLAVKVYICRLTPHAKGSIELLKLRLTGSDIPAWYFPSVPISIVIQIFDWYNIWLSWYQWNTIFDW